jgi:hypothetical protein
MGHLTNPTGFRVGRTLKWPYKWSSDNISYFKYFFIMSGLQSYLFTLFSGFLRGVRKFGILFSHVRLMVSLRTFFVRIFVYSRDFLRLSKRKFVIFISRARFYFPRLERKAIYGNTKSRKRF